MKNKRHQNYAAIRLHVLRSKMRIWGYKVEDLMLWASIINVWWVRCGCELAVDLARMIPTLDVRWQPAKFWVKVGKRGALELTNARQTCNKRPLKNYLRFKGYQNIHFAIHSHPPCPPLSPLISDSRDWTILNDNWFLLIFHRLSHFLSAFTVSPRLKKLT